MNMDELFQEINQAVFVATSKPFKNIDFLKDDLLFVSDVEHLLCILRVLEDSENSILLVLRDGTNIEIKLDENPGKDFPIHFVIDETVYEVISEEFTDSGEDELREIVENTEEASIEKEEEEEEEEENMSDTKIEAHNISTYIQEHLVEIIEGYSWALEEIKNADPDSESFPSLLYDISFTGKLDTGETIEVFESEDSIDHDGGEIAVVVKINDRYFIDHGSYNSWDSNYFNNDFQEVERVEVPVIKIEYKPI